LTTSDEQIPTTGGGVTIHQAALRLGMSESTIRRRIKDGSLKASRIPTSQGFEWRVLLDGQVPSVGDAQVLTTDENVLTAGEEVPIGGEQVATTDDRLATIADDAASTVMEQLRPLLEQLNAERERGEVLQRQNVELAGRCGYLQARLEAAEKQVLALSPPAETQQGGNRPPWWRRLLGMEPA
jgi:hypothetical protein